MDQTQAITLRGLLRSHVHFFCIMILSAMHLYLKVMFHVYKEVQIQY